MTQWSESQLPDASLRGESQRPLTPLVLMGFLGVSTLALAVLTNGNVAASLAPVFGFLAVYTVTKLPLRYLWLLYTGLVMSLDTPAEPFAAGEYHSPLRPLAVVLSSQLKNVFPMGALVMSGLDLLIIGTLLVHAARRMRESPLDRDGYVPAPMPLFVANWACLVAVVLATLWGVATGGAFRFALWQIQRNIYLPLVFLIAQAVFPSPANMKPYMRLLIVVACVRSVLAIWLRFDYPEVEYTTSHSDSMVFAIVWCYLLIRLLHGATKREKWITWPVLALVAWGMVANDRRLVWVELGISFVFVYFMSPWNLLKRRFAQIVLGSIPLVVVYIAAGWQSGSGIFKPVGILRSMADSKSDGSTLWRDLENFNLVTTYTHHPILGTGFGHPYEMAVWMPDITDTYELEPYVPHNSVVGLWAYTGYIGFNLMWLIPLVGAFVAARAYYYSTKPFDRTIALTCFCSVVIYVLQCYGDMGLGSVISVLLLSPPFAMVGKLAVEVGAWPRRGAAAKLQGAGLTHPTLARRPLRQ
ncbi:MAG: O-antigen ligase family protein [Myxococcales bacterium]